MKFLWRTRHVASIVTLAVTLGCALSSDADQSKPDNPQEEAAERPDPSTPASVNPIPGNPRNPGTGDNEQPAHDLREFFLERVVDPVTWFTFGLLVLGVLQYLAMHRQAGYMREGLAETTKAADAAASAARAQTEELRLLHTPSIDLTTPTLVWFGDESGDEPGLYLHVNWDVLNVGATPIRFQRVHSEAKTRGAEQWRVSQVTQRIVGVGRSFNCSIDVGELVDDHLKRFLENRLLVNIQIVVDIFDPVEQRTIQRTFRRQLLCGKVSGVTVVTYTDDIGWPAAQGEVE